MALVKRVLLEAAGDIPIISVSQEPIDLGENICLGKIGRCWLSLYKQLLAGCEAAQSDWVVIAEHDCLYTPEHLNYLPSDADVFWYNNNRWLVQWGGNHPELDGMYSWWPGGLALSQLICWRELLLECMAERVYILEHGEHPGVFGKGEPGVVPETTLAKVRRRALSGESTWMRQFLEQYLTKYEHRTFRTKLPNLDIRHSANFTGPKRGNRRRYELPYWGRWEDVIGGTDGIDNRRPATYPTRADALLVQYTGSN
jgi:hypothetical protein